MCAHARTHHTHCVCTYAAALQSENTAPEKKRTEKDNKKITSLCTVNQSDKMSLSAGRLACSVESSYRQIFRGPFHKKKQAGFIAVSSNKCASLAHSGRAGTFWSP